MMQGAKLIKKADQEEARITQVTAQKPKEAQKSKTFVEGILEDVQRIKSEPVGSKRSSAREEFNKLFVK